ncbi:peptidase dimerization domain-containing protein [Bradyrhizobium ottawaense]
MPHLTRDPVMAAGHLIVALQSVVSRSVDPLDTAVLSLCTIEGGTAPNQIAGRVTIRGTLRYHREAVKDTILDGIERTCAGHRDQLWRQGDARDGLGCGCGDQHAR